MKLKLFISIVLIASFLSGGCGAGQSASPTPSPSHTVTPENTPTPAGEQYQVIYEKIYPGEAKTHEVLVTDVSAVFFSLCWPELEPTMPLDWSESELSLTLISPSGKQIDPSVTETDPNTRYSAELCEGFCVLGPYCKSYNIVSPEQGKWKVSINETEVPKNGRSYAVLVAFETEITLSVTVENENDKVPPDSFLEPGEAINIIAELARGGEAITGASVVADVLTPGNVTDKLKLYDDGQHNDGQADDGRYANVYANTSPWGNYFITVTGSGTANGVEFQRQDGTSVSVYLPPDLSINASDIVFSNNNPDEGETITITATVHNIGRGKATNAQIRFYYDKPWLDIGEDVINVPSNGAAQAKVQWVAIAGDHNIGIDVRNQYTLGDEDSSNNEPYRPIRVSVEPKQ